MDVIEAIQAQRPSPPCARPWVTVSYAQSLDGSVAVQGDAPLALSSPETKHLTHALRAIHDAILVGIGTVIADDPKLTAHRVGGPHPHPIVLDTRLRFPLNARLLRHPRGVIIATGPQPPEARARRLEERGATLLPLPLDEGRVSIPALLKALAQRRLCSLMVEGGPRILTSFFRERAVDWVIITVTPHLVGGTPVFSDLTVELDTPPTRVDAFPRLDTWAWQPMGQDMVIWGRVIWPQ